jgi:hypothetical protein
MALDAGAFWELSETPEKDLAFLMRCAERAAAAERDRCVLILERLHERSGGQHNQYLYAAKVLKGEIDAAMDNLRYAIEQVEKRQWVGLTEGEVNDCIKLPNRNLFARDGTTSQRIARAIEAKLKEKNDVLRSV